MRTDAGWTQWRAEDVALEMLHVETCQCRQATLRTGADVKLIDARCISGYITPSSPERED